MSYMETWEELEANYSDTYHRLETNDEGEITMKIVVEHIKALEAGSGNNVWVRERLTLSNNLDMSFQWFKWQIVQNTSFEPFP